MAGEDDKQHEKGEGYGKRPWWFWALVYVVVGGIVYAGIYYAYATHHSTSGATSTHNSPY
jgi:hypothetical protein